MPLHLINNTLLLDDAPLLANVPDNVALDSDPNGVGVFLRAQSEKPAARHVFSLGDLTGIVRFASCHRYEPFWMKPRVGTQGGEVPQETQFLLVERPDGRVVLFVPLLDGDFRSSLQGEGENGLAFVAESGDPAVTTTQVTGLFVAAGDNPYTLIEAAAQSVQAWMNTGRLRREKPLPDFVDQFGWCTWDAFYQEVSEEKVRQGLETFAAGRVTPKLLILDDGWQSVTALPTGEKRVSAFKANEKFPTDLASTVSMAKQEFGVETFLVWHALSGYWSGADKETLPGYGIRDLPRSYSPGMLHYNPNYNHEWWGSIVGVVPPESIYRFFQDYHRHLRRQGVDGVKVDNQCQIEALATGLGGRVALMRAYHEALEGSIQTQFAGNLINCMSCANDVIYNTLNSTVLRTSTDFWPNLPASHGLHLYTNAQVSLWFGEFIHPDWDMFQSGHKMGAYHAAGRAVGGCPIYVSDKPGEHDFDLLRKLVLPDGSILRALLPGRPTRDCLFHDPLAEDVLLKIFNRNDEGGVIGAFNGRYDAETELSPVAGRISPADVDGLEGERFAVYAHYAKELLVLARDDAWEFTLPSLTAEVFTIAPIVQGVAPIGLADMFNSGGAVLAFSGDETPNVCDLVVRGGGRFLAWCEKSPQQVWVDGVEANFAYTASTNALEFTLPFAPVSALRFVFA